MLVKAPFNRLILRAVLRNVSPMVIRVISVPDSLRLFDFNELFLAVLGWENTGFVFRVHGQEFNSFRRASHPVILSDFHLRPNETILYTCGAVDLWEWDVRLLDEEPGPVGDDAPLCLGGRGATPPQFCGGPTGYRLMLKRQRMGEAMCTPVQMEAVIAMLAVSDPEATPETWRSYREMLNEGFESIDRRLQEYGPLEPERFNLEEANQFVGRTYRKGWEV